MSPQPPNADAIASDDTAPPIAGEHATKVVAIDGPSGAGKSTVARALAVRMGFAYLDTGAMYRAVTWEFLAHQFGDVANLDARGRREVLSLLDDMEMKLGPNGEVTLNGEDVSSHLRSREVESRVSAVSAMPEVRHRMRALQREVALAGPVVAEGRDMGSVVFPRALWKVFLDAEPEERARRRLGDFEGRGRAVSFEQVLDEIAVRDRLDSTRADAPLLRIPGAVYFDTTGMKLDDVVERLAQLIAENQDGLPENGEVLP